MSNAPGFVDFILDQLGELDGVRAKAMFGGHGLYLGPNFFGIVYDDRLYLKTDDGTRGWYEARGMTTFRPNERQHLKTYYEVPADVVEDRAGLAERAAESADLGI
jgi:DNA transformation protein